MPSWGWRALACAVRQGVRVELSVWDRKGFDSERIRINTAPHNKQMHPVLRSYYSSDLFCFLSEFFLSIWSLLIIFVALILIRCTGAL